MALYLSACDLYLTKPGGLSTTEAAVVGLPLVALHPIPGCETKNARFFTSHQFAVSLSQIRDLAHRLTENDPAPTTP